MKKLKISLATAALVLTVGGTVIASGAGSKLRIPTCSKFINPPECGALTGQCCTRTENGVTKTYDFPVLN